MAFDNEDINMNIEERGDAVSTTPTMDRMKNKQKPGLIPGGEDIEKSTKLKGTTLHRTSQLLVVPVVGRMRPGQNPRAPRA